MTPGRVPPHVLVAVALPLVVLSIDFSGVAVALPRIASDLGTTTASAGWVINAFALGAAGPLLAPGRIADRYGRRRFLLLGVSLFTIGTLGAALAPTFGLLVLARVVQGVATSLFMTASLSVVSTAYSDRRVRVSGGGVPSGAQQQLRHRSPSRSWPTGGSVRSTSCCPSRWSRPVVSPRR